VETIRQTITGTGSAGKQGDFKIKQETRHKNSRSQHNRSNLTVALHLRRLVDHFVLVKPSFTRFFSMYNYSDVEHYFDSVNPILTLFKLCFSLLPLRGGLDVPPCAPRCSAGRPQSPNRISRKYAKGNETLIPSASSMRLLGATSFRAAGGAKPPVGTP